jgi:hypothetical protein
MASPFNWSRSAPAGLSWTANKQIIAAIPQGGVLRCVRFSWGFSGYTSQTANILQTLQQLMVFGIVTTVGNGTESVPNPRTAPNNAAPPTQRWLWWEGRAPQVESYSDSADAVFYRDTPQGEPTNVQSMVSGATIPSGDDLNVWASWAPPGPWDVSGQAELWLTASVGWTPPA